MGIHGTFGAKISGPDWSKITEDEAGIALRIVKRWEREHGKPPGYKRINLLMDIEAAHLDCRMNLESLLESDSVTFAHDIGGITKHMDRATGKLGGCFVPRTARGLP